MDIVLRSLLPSPATTKFKDAVSTIINVQDTTVIQWNEVEDLIAEYSETSPSVFKEYPFLIHHILPKDPPVAIVKAIVMARPECLKLLDVYTNNGEQQSRQVEATPLGVACRSGASLDVIRFLIRTMVRLQSTERSTESQSQQQRSRGYYANYTNIHKRVGGLFTTTNFGDCTMSLQVMRILLEEHPDGVLCSDGLSKSTLAADFAFFRARTGAERVASVGLTADDYFEKLELILMAGSKGTIKEEELKEETPFLLPHALLEAVTCTGRFQQKNVRDERDYFHLDCDETILVLVSVKDRAPHQFLEKDEAGNLPIHIALSNRRFAHHAKQREYGSKIIRFLLQCHPECITIPDGRDRLPLHIAITSLAPCYRIILDASPPWVLETKCPVTGLYPFQIPSPSAQNDSQMKLWVELSYTILQKAPMLARAAKTPSWFDSTIFKEIQIAKMKKEQQAARIVQLERQLEQQLKLCAGSQW